MHRSSSLVLWWRYCSSSRQSYVPSKRSLMKWIAVQSVALRWVDDLMFNKGRSNRSKRSKKSNRISTIDGLSGTIHGSKQSVQVYKYRSNVRETSNISPALLCRCDIKQCRIKLATRRMWMWPKSLVGVGLITLRVATLWSVTVCSVSVSSHIVRVLIQCREATNYTRIGLSAYIFT